MLEPLAVKFKEAAKAGGQEVLFFFTKGGDPVSPQIRKLCGLKPKPEPQLVLLDIPDNGGYYVADVKSGLTADSVETFVNEVLSGAGTRQQLSRG